MNAPYRNILTRPTVAAYSTSSPTPRSSRASRYVRRSIVDGGTLSLHSLQPTIIKSITMSTIVLGLITVFTYLPQVAVLAFVSGPLAFIAAVPVVLGESWLIITFLNKAFYVKEASEKVFDAVLAQRGFSDLVEKGRTVRKGGGGGMTLGKSLLKPISSKFSTVSLTSLCWEMEMGPVVNFATSSQEGLVRYVISLPLNAIPAVGTLFFLFYNGQNAGP